MFAPQTRTLSRRCTFLSVRSLSRRPSAPRFVNNAHAHVPPAAPLRRRAQQRGYATTGTGGTDATVAPGGEAVKESVEKEAVEEESGEEESVEEELVKEEPVKEEPVKENLVKTEPIEDPATGSTPVEKKSSESQPPEKSPIDAQQQQELPPFTLTHRITTLDPTKLTPSDYVSLAHRKRARLTSVGGKNHILLFNHNLWHDGTAGFLYVHTPPRAPALASSLRFRLTQSSDPASFAEGKDLTWHKGLPWEYPLLFLGKSMPVLRYLLERDQMFSLSQRRQLTFLAGVVNTKFETDHFPCDDRVQLVYSRSQPLIFDFQTRKNKYWLLAEEKGKPFLSTLVIPPPGVLLREDERKENMEKYRRVPLSNEKTSMLYSGRAIICIGKDSRPRIKQILSPIEQALDVDMEVPTIKVGDILPMTHTVTRRVSTLDLIASPTTTKFQALTLTKLPDLPRDPSVKSVLAQLRLEASNPNKEGTQTIAEEKADEEAKGRKVGDSDPGTE